MQRRWTNLIDRAQLKWQSYSRQKAAKTRSMPFLLPTQKPVTKEKIQVSVFGLLFGMASINGLYPFGLSFMAANSLYRGDYILPAFFSFLVL